MSKHGSGETSGTVGGSTFLIRIQFQQNATWQGTIQWLDHKKTVPFRSMLEMITLIQEALEEAQASGSKARFLSWEDKEEVI